MTETLTLELENYQPKDIVNFVIYHLVGTELSSFHFKANRKSTGSSKKCL